MSPSNAVTKARIALGQAIREIRERQGYDVEAFATASGVSQRTITRVEAGDRESNYELLIALARGLGVQASEIYRRADELEERPDER